ncbi:MAG: AAA family ATPase [Candidatus Paceibacterota bacterium]
MTQNQALTILKTGASVFLTGEPGAGKTFTINAFVSYLKEHGIEPAITASTGIAATHIQGQTIHSWSGIGIRKTLSPYDLDKLSTTEYLVRRINKTKVLIIDEVSMIDGFTLDLVDAVCKTIKQSPEPFGGIQVVLVGDFFQLPPISRYGDVVPFAFEARVWKEMKPLVCYLTEQHRQSDETFLHLLSAIRRNERMDDHMIHLEQRLISDSDSFDDTENMTRLYAHNADVDAINTAALNAIDGPTNTYTMFSKGSESLVASLKKGCLSPERLDLKIGVAVMCTKNNMQKGYVNGTTGTVMRFETGTKYPIIQTKNREEITIEPMDWTIEEDGKVKATIGQIPLRLAWAITIHKSQGLSLDNAMMDLRQVFEFGQGYVALSRVRTLSGLYLAGWNAQTFQVHPRILQEDQIFHEQSDSAQGIFANIEPEDIETMHKNFILAAGGTLEAKKGKSEKIEKKDTLDLTKDLVLEGKSLSEIAKARKMVATTILDHIEKLIILKKLNYENIAHFVDAKLQKALPTITVAFSACDTTLLSPVYNHLDGKYTFDTLRLARAVIAAKNNK